MSKEQLTFYFTNDLHSHFLQWPKVAAYLLHKQETHKTNQETFWTLDIGDHVDRSHPITEASRGKANIDLLNQLNYDVVTLGNNEGITLSHDELYHLYDHANFSVVCSNLESLDGQLPAWLKRSEIKETASGIRIGFLGLTAPFNAFYELLDWYIDNEFDVLDRYITELEKETDIIVLLSHLGISVDQEIARRYPSVDIIMGGHTHHLLQEGERINHTLITAAGKHCFYVGEVTVEWSHEENRITNRNGYAVDLRNTIPDLNTEQYIQSLYEQSKKYLDNVIVKANKPIEVNWFANTPIIQSLTTMLRKWTKADFAMLNAGVLLESLPAGPITYGDIHRICPHPINPVLVDLKGDELIEVIRASLSKDFTELKLKGFGFRGEILGKMIFSGLDVITGFHRTGGEYVKAVYEQNGKQIDPDQTYYIATADTFTFGRLLPEIAKSTTKQYFVPEFLRDLLAETLLQQYSS
ncbi:bifunctional metallophosphatase/5'-nucleotidase [Oceanobacillus sp. 1P07AA]|uniref:bifunctional metallophosphatase/5'-nucleotidase n=1 Tax=Oceanobacillus sp. 1P07AA TaxID=3132293 RepID=UPI0039A433A3